MDMRETEEQSLERYLQRSDSLSRAYQEMGDERPSASLDLAVISEARSAIAEQPQPRRSQWRWAGITALAATVLLAFAVVMRIALEPQPAAPAATTEGQRANPEPTTTTSSLARENYVPVEPASNAPLAAPAFEGRLAAPSAKKEDTVRASNEEDEGVTRAPRHLQGASARQDLTTALDATKPSAAAAAAPASPRAASPDAYGAAAPAVLPASKEALQKTGVKPPEEWLDEIARLRANGEEEAAEREYAEFRKTYPEYVRDSAATPAR
jgi:hypothetical protein